ncbi:vegetative cell wall protein gp1-like [Penaeus japonicus]|uniref:vegetative cell wall protein gp1-like n=1 Tax=Penaeus japonicus TaxID=27405 RepID=UPI001C711484|nr:vegetative cell wall protein gp1-like [Penaeus japonicus]
MSAAWLSSRRGPGASPAVGPLSPPGCGRLQGLQVGRLWWLSGCWLQGCAGVAVLVVCPHAPAPSSPYPAHTTSTPPYPEVVRVPPILGPPLRPLPPCVRTARRASARRHSANSRSPDQPHATGKTRSGPDVKSLACGSPRVNALRKESPSILDKILPSPVPQDPHRDRPPAKPPLDPPRRQQQQDPVSRRPLTRPASVHPASSERAPASLSASRRGSGGRGNDQRLCAFPDDSPRASVSPGDLQVPASAARTTSHCSAQPSGEHRRATPPPPPQPPTVRSSNTLHLAKSCRKVKCEPSFRSEDKCNQCEREERTTFYLPCECRLAGTGSLKCRNSS